MHLLSALRRSGALRSFTGLWLVAFLSFGPALSAAIRNVPGTYPSITAALAASSSGDTIQVAAGTYDEVIEDFPLELKDGVAIVGADRTTTFITPNAGTPAFVNDNTTLGATTRVEGFTLSHPAGSDEGLMIFILGSATMSPVITDNIFIGNADETDGGIFIGGISSGGTFDGNITDNQFTGFVSASSPGPQAQLAPVETFNSGGIFMVVAPAEIGLRKHGGVASQAALPGEDNIAPTISGNTFDGNEVGVAAVGAYYDYSYAASGVVAPVIDGNTFDGNLVDVLLGYAGVGAREFTPSVTNNNSSNSAFHVAALPFLTGSGLKTGGVAASAAKTAPVSLEARLRAMQENVLHHRMGAGASQRFAKRLAARAARVNASGAEVLPATLADYTISGNTVTDAQFAGVLMYQYMYGGEGLDLRIDVSNNAVSGGDAFGGILIGAEQTPEATPIPDVIDVRQNHVSGSLLGLAIQFSACSCSQPPPSTNANVVVPDPVNDIQIVGNILENGGTGLQISDSDYTSLAPLVSCNLIRNNTTAGVVIEDSTDPNPDFGGGVRLSPGKNSIHDNGGVDMANNDADLVKAENNWWGTTNLATIETNTFDFTEDNTKGDIDFDPPLAAEATDCIVSSGNADLAIAKTVTSTGPYVVGSNITYQLTVTNNGPDGANNVVISDPLPAGTSFVSASAGCSFASNTITCTAATLANGASTSFNVTVQATMSGSVVNTATVDSDETDGTPGNSTATAPAVPVGAAAVTPIPTTSEWGLMLMGLFLAMTGLWFTRRM